MQAYSMDLRERVMWDVDAGLGTHAIAAKYRVSTRWVQLLKRRRAETGEIRPRNGKRGPPSRIGEYAEELIALVQQKPDATLHELQRQLTTPVSISSIWRALKTLGLTFKKSPARLGAGSA